MRTIPILVAVMALPLMALGQEQQQAPAQGQTNENQEKTPAQKKAKHPTHEATKPETGAKMQAAPNAESHGTKVKKNEATSSSHTQTKVVNKEEFKSSHQEVFRLGQHPKEYFVQRYGASHFRLIGNSYFVFVDGCWVSVDVVGFTFTERIICQGDPDYIVVY